MPSAGRTSFRTRGIQENLYYPQTHTEFRLVRNFYDTHLYSLKPFFNPDKNQYNIYFSIALDYA